MVQQLTWAFGAIFVAVGVLGFVPGATSGGYLLGIFEVDSLHNMVHLLSGVVALLVAGMAPTYARMYFQVFGVVYLLVTISGFVMGSAAGLFVVNMADNILHVAISAVALWAGFLSKGDGVAPMPLS
ncbi:MAG: DUF4383 domain-containing protein [Patescibacteria group bacterium]